MKKIQYLIAAMLFAFPVTSLAQVEVDIDDEEEDTEIIAVEEDDEEDEEEVDEADTIGDIELPEALSLEVDSLLELYNTQQYLQVDSECNFQNVNPTYDPEVYQARLSRLPTIIEMPYNSVVQDCIDRYSGRLRRTVSIMLGSSNFYMPIFEQALETYGLPLELKYLPVIESALNPNAVSRVGATGLWQFMLATGKQYGLEVNSLVDDRRDPIKASYAAAHYLSDLYKIFGDWHLVIASYNCGPENVNKAIHRAGGVKDYWKIYPYLPRETRGYVPAFIAANYIMSYYCEHNICPMIASLPSKTDTIMVDRDVHFEQIAGVLGVSVKEIESLNPQYRRSVVNGGSRPSVLRLQPKDIIAFIDNQDSIYAYRADELLTKRSTVEVDTSSAPAVSSKRSSRSRRGRSSARGRSATIRQGDTLSAIAKRNGTTVAKLKRLNPSIKGSNIRAGKKIRVK
ncbi:MAG: transglycosylase SLT domain-containing protein [Prevotellaceae bacterium]|nr:transglycosylase SLT domain-containing protein [Prevotellaceae bacterium]